MFGPSLVLVGLLAGGFDDPGSKPADAVRREYDATVAKIGVDPSAQVGLALWCERNGLHAERLMHLGKAVLANPNQAAARGLMGLVEFGGQWVSPDAVPDEMKQDPAMVKLLAEYKEKREKLPNNVDYHYQLGLWCEQKGLKDEAIAHFTTVARRDPTNENAWKHLGYKKRNGVWMSDERWAAIQDEQKKQASADRKWYPIMKRYKNLLSDKERSRREEGEAKLAEVDDPRAVPAIWSVFATAGPAGQEVAVKTISQLSGIAASRALAILALTSETESTRSMATNLLRKRDGREFIGDLIAAIRQPIKYQVQPPTQPGMIGVLFVEGERANVARQYQMPATMIVPDRFFTSDIAFMPLGDWRSPVLGARANATVADRARSSDSDAANNLIRNATQVANNRDIQIRNLVVQNAMAVERDRRELQAKLDNDVRAIEATNSQINTTNTRATAALVHVTGQDFGMDTEAWKQWNADQDGYVYKRPAETRPKRTLVETVVLDRPLSLPHTACFAAGTPVVTVEGERPIEQVQMGDRVLVQDGKTGKLSYQAVVAVFHNPPNATLRLKLEDDTIVATGIHRFWKAGQGWVMARDLKPGDVLRTLGGTQRVVEVSNDRVQPVFNLEVAAGRSFFVGKAGALVHDNTLVETLTEPFDSFKTTSLTKP